MDIAKLSTQLSAADTQSAQGMLMLKKHLIKWKLKVLTLLK